ncbi:hypothetical protein [Scopulibacillus cellulosilyticus]|uniref:Uncharacterized protein n=1 Tax=Scopulibacillus cellulosilyticus TaxID=2665665 RepID=A0ABW2PX05_9BACL
MNKQLKKTAPIYPMMDNENNWNPNVNNNANPKVNPNPNANTNPNINANPNPNVNPNINPHSDEIHHININESNIEPKSNNKPKENIHEIPIIENELPNMIHPKEINEMPNYHPSMNSMPLWEWESKKKINDKKPVLNKPLEDPWAITKEENYYHKFDNSNLWEDPYLKETTWHGTHIMPEMNTWQNPNVMPEVNQWHGANVNPEMNTWYNANNMTQSNMWHEANVNPEMNAWQDANIMPESSVWHEANVNPEMNTWHDVNNMTQSNMWHEANVNPEINPWHGSHVNPEINPWYQANVMHESNVWHGANINPEINTWYDTNYMMSHYPSASHYPMHSGYGESGYGYYGQQMSHQINAYPNQEYYYQYQSFPPQADCGCDQQPNMNMYYQPSPEAFYYDPGVPPTPPTPPTPPVSSANREENNNNQQEEEINQRWDSYANYQQPPYLPQFPTSNKKDE